jgi:hypothetical protein
MSKNEVSVRNVLIIDQKKMVHLNHGMKQLTVLLVINDGYGNKLNMQN